MHRTTLLSKTRTLAVVVLLGAVVTAAAPGFVRIRSGDTLSELAQRHGTSVSELRRLNSLGSSSRIFAGDLLRVSGSSGGGSARSGGSSYTVRPGDTLSHLAVRFDTTVAALRSRNGLSGRLIAGTRIVVPSGGSSAGGSSAGGASSVGSSAGRGSAGAVSASVSANRAALRSRPQPSKAQVRRMVADTARRHGVSPVLALAVSYHESGFQQRVVSGVNAIGVMQVLPSTARVLSQQHGRSLNIMDTQDNITAGVLLLRQLQRSLDSEQMVLAGYYQGLGSIAKKGLLPQTHDYIRSIGYLKKRFANG